MQPRRDPPARSLSLIFNYYNPITPFPARYPKPTPKPLKAPTQITAQSAGL